MNPILIIARTVIKESVRTRFWLIYGLILLSCLGGAHFASQLVLADDARTRILVLGTLLRPMLVTLLILHIAASVSREIQEKGRDMVLASGISYPALILGRILGYTLIAIMLSLGTGLLLSLEGAHQHLTIWLVGLTCELVLLSVLTLAITLVLRQVAGAALATGAFYILGHNLSAVLLMARHPMGSAGATDDSLAKWSIESIAWLIPRFDLFGSADWLVGLRSGQFSPILIQTVIYLVLLYAIAILDSTLNRDAA